MIRPFAVFACVFVAACSSPPPEPALGAPFERCVVDPPGFVTLAGLVTEVADLDRLMRTDATPYERRLASSSNPLSDLMTPSTWYGDADAYIRLEGTEKVILESTRPGAIVRFWTANPNGRVRIYLDGSPTPVIDEDMVTFFATSGGPFERPFVYESALGHNLVEPISWSQSAKVTVTSSSLYYTLDYREYAPDVVVETYPGTPSVVLDCARTQTALTLEQGSADPPTTNTFELDSSSTASAAELTAGASGSVIRLLRLQLATTERAVLERTALRVDIDGLRTMELPLSAALVPMSDAAIVESLPISSSNGEWLLRLPMPFATSARIALEDRGGGAVTGTLHVAVEPMEVTDDTYRLFAAYVGPTDVDISDWPGQPTLSTIDGQGRFVGLVYEIGNDDAAPQWWGEGDPILTVDGSTMRGTGTEDHFLFGFCSTERFHSPFSGQTRANASDHGGFVSLYRFHTSDDVPFLSSFDFEFEMLGWGTYNGHTIRMPMSAVTWFYGRPATVFTGATGNAAVYTPMTLPDGAVRPGGGFITCK